MSDRKWTEQQLNAINARNRNLLVSAAAGSGKSTVLVERVIRKIIEDKVDISKLLIVTFTNAAASELRIKVSKALKKALLNNADVSDRNFIIRQINQLPNSKICTIDSFSIGLVREHFYKLGISENFSIIDSADDLAMQNEVLLSICNEKYESKDEQFYSLVDLFSNDKNDKGFINAILGIYRSISSFSNPIEGLKEAIESYNPTLDFKDTSLFEIFDNRIISFKNYIVDAFNEIDSSIAKEEDDVERQKLADIFNSDREKFNLIFKNMDDVEYFLKQLKDIDFDRFPKSKSYYKDHVKMIRNSYIKKAKRLKETFDFEYDDYLNGCEIMYPLMTSLYDFVSDFSNRLISLKKERNMFSFADVLHLAIELLEDNDGTVSEVGKYYRDIYDEILIDEYQDTNEAQDKLFEIISNGRNVFVVGDIKQSIYKFRLADPNLFNKKRNSYSIYEKNSKELNNKILLSKNFRSREGICDFTNFLFSKIMSEEVGEINYGKEDELVHGAQFNNTDAPCAQIKIVNLEDVDKNDSYEYEARCVAKLILDKISNKEQIGNTGETRNITFKDFAILFRNTKEVLDVYSKVFTEFGIPHKYNNKEKLFETKEISILLSLLKTIDNPTLDIPLMATLLSPFYGYSNDDIIEVKIGNKNRSLYNCIINSEAFNSFICDLNKYKELASTMSMEKFIRNIVYDKSLIPLMSTYGNVEQRKLNINRFISLASSFDSNENIGLSSFIRYIDSIIDSGSNIECPNPVNTDSNCVQLMTIHHSKGLEYPVVILANSNRSYNKQDTRSSININHKYGLGVDIKDFEKSYKYSSFQNVLIKMANTNETMSEALRVLYVAITRAKEQFICIYPCKDIDKKVSSLSSKIFDKKIPPSDILEMNCDGDIILTCSLLHEGSRELLDNEKEACDFELSIDYIEPNDINTSDSDTVLKEIDKTLLEEISEKLSYKYKYSNLSGFVAKRSASSLENKELNYNFFAKSKPSFMEKEGKSAAEKGTAMHNFMQYCDYSNALNDIDKEKERLLSAGKLSNEQINVLDTVQLSNMFKSTLFNRMFNASRIEREYEVSCLMNVSLFEDTEFDDDILIQGVVDCFFIENNNIILVDYKTDKVNNTDELKTRYYSQMRFYKMALEKKLGLKVTEIIIYSFNKNVEVPFTKEELESMSLK